MSGSIRWFTLGLGLALALAGSVAASASAPPSPGAFKTPILRNLSLTAPYMHDGSEATLESVMELYVRGGNRRRSERIPPPAGPTARRARSASRDRSARSRCSRTPSRCRR